MTRGSLLVTGALVLLAAVLYLGPREERSRAAGGTSARSVALVARADTLPALEAALAAGVTALQFDLVLTGDEVLVLHQGLRLAPARTRGPDGVWLEQPLALYDLLADDLALYDIGRSRDGSPPGLQQDGVRIPRLAAAVAVAERRSGGALGYLLTMQRAPLEPGLAPDATTAAARLAETLTALGIAGRSQVQSFDWAFLAAFQAVAPQVPTVYLTSEQPDSDTIGREGEAASPWLGGHDLHAAEGSLPLLVQQAGGSAWSPDYRDLRPVELEEAHRLGLRVLAQRVDDPAVAASLVELGLDGLVTDDPAALREVMAAAGLALPPAFPP